MGWEIHLVGATTPFAEGQQSSFVSTWAPDWWGNRPPDATRNVDASAAAAWLGVMRKQTGRCSGSPRTSEDVETLRGPV